MTISRLEEELRTKDRRYEILLAEFERYKINNANTHRPKDDHNQQRQLLETLIGHMREESASQNRASIDLINSMMNKFDNEKKPSPPREK